MHIYHVFVVVCIYNCCRSANIIHAIVCAIAVVIATFRNIVAISVAIDTPTIIITICDVTIYVTIIYIGVMCVRLLYYCY